ncbi:MAG TPA: PilZ domain-containing protein [Gaiellales bacterium]|nr:PilZ domain-containing protein [Gaiellales bacterium]
MSEPLFEQSEADRLLDEFLAMLPIFPTTIGVFSAEGGVAEVVLADLDQGLLVGYAPQILMQKDLIIVCPLRDAGGGGYDISLKVEKAYFQSGDQTLLHLSVVSIEHQPGHRRSKRARRTDQADIVVLYSKGLDAGTRMVGRLADISEDGVAFVSELPLAIGDRVMLSIHVGARPITLEAQVVRDETVAFGRHRIGCEVNAIAEHDRKAVTAIAASGEEGDVSERRPDLVAARAQNRVELHALKERLTIRRRYRQR